jgi:hypothetical protein
METDEKSDVRWEAYYLLKLVLYDKKEGLSSINAVTNGIYYNMSEARKRYGKKYGLQSSLEGIAFELQDYIEKCDEASFDSEKNFRKYSVRPYLSEEVFDMLETFVDYSLDAYGIDDISVKVLPSGNAEQKKAVKVKQGLDSILDAISSTEFVFNTEDCVSFFDKNKLVKL